MWYEKDDIYQQEVTGIGVDDHPTSKQNLPWRTGLKSSDFLMYDSLNQRGT